MNKSNLPVAAQHTTAELDDAAVWIARLRAPDRSATVERGFRRWLQEKPGHAAAFETISSAWELTGALQRRPFPKLTRWERAGFRAGFVRSVTAVAAVVGVVSVGALLQARTSGVKTAVGEQRVLTLEDGTRVSLNTGTRVVVRYGRGERRVELKSGEALFEVAAEHGRPFIVMAADRQIKALGTSFIVREDSDRLSVILVEGKVAVSSQAGTTVSSPAILTPGQRLIFGKDTLPKLDRPAIERVTAWRRGQVEFEDTSLVDAAAEMNRYSTFKLRIGSPGASTLRINGVFRTGDTEGFAAAVARSYGLSTARNEKELSIIGVPAKEALSAR